jgi:outer membrane protein
MKKIILVGLILGSTLSFSVEGKKDEKPKKNYSFSIGAMVGSSSRLYKTEGKSVSYRPIIGAEVGNFYLVGTEVGYKKKINPKLTLTGFSQIFGGLALQGLGGALGGATLDNSDMKEGYRGINDRKTQVEFGIRGMYDTDIHVRLVGEVRGGERGGTAKTSVIRQFRPTQRFIVVPQLNFTVLNKNITNYYFGVTESEANSSESWKIDKEYKVGNIGFATSIGLAGSYYITRKLSLFVLTEIQYVSDEIKDSPIVDTNINYYVGTGVKYKF